MIVMMALVLTIIRLLVAQIRAAFFPRVLAWFMELAVPFGRAVELWLIIAAVLAVVIPAAGLLAVVLTMAAAATIIAIALARGTVVTASVLSIVASMAAVKRVLSEGLIITSVG